MGYKTLDQNISFAEVALASSMENNLSLKMMEKVNQIIDWSHIETLLMEHYQAGTSKEGADAYPPFNAVKRIITAKVVSHSL